MEKLILFCLLILIGCSKDQLLRKTDGSWKINMLELEDGEGFIYYTKNISGEFTINYEGRKINCNLVFSYVNIQGTQITDSVVWDNLSFDLKKENSIIFEKNGMQIELGMLLATKKSLVMAYYDINKYQLFKFVFSR